MTDRDGRHEPESGRNWSESWAFDFADDHGLGGYVRLGLYPNQRRAWFWACLVVPGRPGPIVVHDQNVPMPRAASLEIRSEGLWAELLCETSMEHWSIGLEAFGVALDSAAEALDPRGEIGERIGLGFDLEWEVETPPRELGNGYQQHGIVHGEILLGDERFAFDGLGARDHAWGDCDWWQRGWHRSALRLGELTFGIEGDDWVDPVGVTFTVSDGRQRIRYEVPGIGAVTAVLVAEAPLRLVDDTSGRVAHLYRNLYRVTHGGDATHSWCEFLVPQPS